MGMSAPRVAACACVLLLQLVSGLCAPPALRCTRWHASATLATTLESGKAVALAALCSASLLCTPHSVSAATLEEAIVEVSETSYPIIKALRPETFRPFSEKVANLILDIKTVKLGPSISAAADVFNSVPAATRTEFTGVVKDAFENLRTDSCTLVPLPPPNIVERFSAIATETVDPAKLKAFEAAWGPALGALAKTDDAICLPPVATLERLALAQAEVGRSFGAVESKAFEKATVPTLKSTLTINKLLPLIDDAKRLASAATPKEKAAFQAAGKKVEYAAKQEALRAKLAAAKQLQAAAKTDAADLAASRQAAIEATAARKAAELEARELKKAELLAAQQRTYAELRAKAEAAKAAAK